MSKMPPEVIEDVIDDRVNVMHLKITIMDKLRDTIPVADPVNMATALRAVAEEVLLLEGRANNRSEEIDADGTLAGEAVNP